MNLAQKQYIYECFKNSLDVKFESLGNKRMKDVFGFQTQTLIREAIHTHCFYKDLKPSIKKEKTGVDEEGKDIIKEIYIFKLKLKTPVADESFNIIREINKKTLDSK